MHDEERQYNYRMKFDDFLKIIGEFGLFQRRTYCLQLLPVLLTGMQVMAPVFILDVPAHRFVAIVFDPTIVL